MKIRMLDSIGGQFHDYPNGVKRGDVVDVPAFDARRYIVNLLATRQLDGPLPSGNEVVQEAAALRDDVLKAVAAMAHNPENDPRPGAEPIVTPRQRVVSDGWGV